MLRAGPCEVTTRSSTTDTAHLGKTEGTQLAMHIFTAEKGDYYRIADGITRYGSLFSDTLHPSAFVHGLFARAALEIYGVPVPGTLALVALALLMLVVVQRSRAGRGRVMAAAFRPAAR